MLKQSAVKNYFFWFNIIGIFFKSYMSRLINKCHQHFKSIIISLSKMMNFFFKKKITSYLFFYYQTMFSDIIIGHAKRMIRFVNHYITIFVNKFSIFPKRIIFSSRKTISIFI